MRTITHAALAALVMTAFMLCNGCGSIGQKSPSQVVKATFKAANEGNYSEAEKYFSSNLLNIMKGPMAALSGGLKSTMDEKTRNGTIKEIEILKEHVRGEGATVNFRVHFKYGQSQDRYDRLIKENGQWKIEE